MKNNFKNIFITGGAGFIGSHISEAFFKSFNKSKITILDKLTYAGNKKFLSSIIKSPRVKFIKSDILIVFRILHGGPKKQGYESKKKQKANT